ncbi:MAG: PLP-dependent transferase, partial [Woeseiaceae bacterium]
MFSKGKSPAPETCAAQALHFIDPASGGVVPPVHTATTYARDRDYALLAAGLSYGRDHNPGFRVAEQLLACLENGHQALLFSSGMAAAMAIVQALEPGGHIVA